ncbi:CAP domain-containing protein [Aureisphaera galaxeae]|uniref:CAP domain-containing protein n=1 Tax=Aureisphaera galaxeae TaxID=1538023 RepID=UPI00235052CD|nr:CAP domain-containing protein [Aureisphaera galaxeae]MDC8005276.1 CAP domain-containing protein [Aureisphaera galaxeae]
MNLLKTSLLATVLFLTVTSCSKEETAEVQEANISIDLNLAQETDWTMANEVLALVNDHRIAMGLSTIVRDQQYASAYAVEHTKYMIEMSQINHDNFGDRSRALKDRGAESVGENVASGYDTAEALVTAWLSSPSHRRVLEGNYTHSGFGIMQNARGKYYFTQLFYRK